MSCWRRQGEYQSLHALLCFHFCHAPSPACLFKPPSHLLFPCLLSSQLDSLLWFPVPISTLHVSPFALHVWYPLFYFSVVVVVVFSSSTLVCCFPSVLLFLISCMFLSLMLFSSLLFTCLLIFFLFFASYLSNRLSLEPLFFFLHTHSAPTLDRFFRYRKLSTFEPVTLVHFGGMLWLQAVHVGCECVCVHLCVSACFHLWACGSGKAFI